MNVIGSVADTSNNRLDISRVNANAETRPIATPAIVSDSP